MSTILVVEDTDDKYEQICAVLNRCLPNFSIARARDLFEGERAVSRGDADLLILDMSLDVRAGSGRSGSGSHDYTGGLKITARMYYLERELPTIIMTNFDSFPTRRAAEGSEVVLGLDEVRSQAEKHLGKSLIGTLRYGPQGWDSAFSELLKQFVGQAS
jgi:CheY-like chemotaxis protein